MAATYTPHPLRIQRKRTKGWRMPEGAIYCGLPGPWGNPFATAEKFRDLLEAILGISGRSEFHECDLKSFATVNAMAPNITKLRGKQLACWCPLDRPCHVDVLAEIANAEQEKRQ